jgi:hypothetical protein
MKLAHVAPYAIGVAILAFVAPPGLAASSYYTSSLYVAGDALVWSGYGLSAGYGGFFVLPDPQNVNTLATLTVADTINGAHTWAEAIVGQQVSTNGTGTIVPSSETCFQGTLSGYSVPAGYGVYVLIYDNVASYSDCAKQGYPVGDGTVGMGYAQLTPS